MDEESLAVDLIEEMEFCGNGAHIQAEHALRRFRQVLWDARLLDRTFRKGDVCPAAQADAELLQRADQSWRDLVARKKPMEVDPRFRAEVERIAQAAREDLLG